MNMLWMAVITLLVLVERVVPQRMRVSGLVGGALVAWGMWVLAFRGV